MRQNSEEKKREGVYHLKNRFKGETFNERTKTTTHYNTTNSRIFRRVDSKLYMTLTHILVKQRNQVS